MEPFARMQALAGPAPASPMLARGDLRLALLLALAALALYAALGLRLAQGQYAELSNLAFDFDPPRYVAIMALEEHQRGNVKHPLIVLLRPLAWPLLAAGFAPKQAAALVMAGMGAATVGVVFLYLRSLSVAAATAAALAVLFAVSGCQVVTSMIPEAYGAAALGVAATWLLAVWRLADLRHGRAMRFVLAAYSYGVTTTNVLQPVLAEGLAWLRHRGPVGAIRPMVLYGTAVVLLCAALTALVWFDMLAAFLADPLAVARTVYWQRTRGFREDLLETVLRLVGFSVVSPRFTLVELAADGITMLDFRAPSFEPLGQAAFLAWHAFWLAGAVAAVRHRPTRFLALGLWAMLLINIAFHLEFQFRGSIYLYAGHTHFLVFALGAGLAPVLRAGGAAGRIYLGVVLVLAGLVGAVTLERAWELATAFDDVRVGCLAPCAEPQR
jgi:hypothetical protein